MANTLNRALLAIMGLLIAATASADPLTFYTDRSAWLAAVSGRPVGANPFPAVETRTLVTLKTFPDVEGCCIYLSTALLSNATDFSSLNYDFAQTGQLIDQFCLGVRDCSVTGTADDVTVTLSSPIRGFASTMFNMDDAGYGLFLDGQPLPQGSGSGYDGFFGVVGAVSSLDFHCGQGSLLCAFTDDFELIGLTNIVVVTAREPSALASFAGALFLFAITLIRFAPISAARGKA